MNEKLSEKRILLFTRVMGSGGTETVIIQLTQLYREAGCFVCVCAADGPGMDKLRQQNVPVYVIPDMQSKDPVTMAKILSTVAGIIRSQKIDVVHTHHRMAAFYARLLRPMHKFLFLNNIHNTFEDKRSLTRFAFQKACNIAVGQAVMDNMVKDYGLSEKVIRVIYNAVKAPVVSDTPDPLLDQLRRQGKFLVGNVGRVDTQKGFEYYIAAAKLCKQKALPIAFLIVGDGTRREEMEQLVKAEGLSDTVYFLGYRTDVANVIAQTDLMVLSSLWEGFPLTPIEVFSVKKTIVATDVPGTMEIVKDGENGLIVPMKDAAALAEGVERLYKDPALRLRLEENARKTYENIFSYEIFCNHYLRLLEEQIGERA